ncbi:hypothetical protein GCM10011297_03930 [Bacterioplanes sanyensis]|uniref:DUF2489 domain-containing protein n=1 Tax=Bacterioplanes sanyensis TaxID=1249553 RepID=UPI001677673F|nr:DUF2489 domain-containing protein [Bacterioplanes sanyensis]GGY34131.1 hypothetical protein GCM10011297_03930 [Bacterioplanes sanyensis]
MTTFLILIAVAIVAGLAGYAWTLTRRVKDMQQRQQQEEVAAAEALRNKQLELMNDVQFVARAVIAEQCEITEGVLRIHYLVQALDPAIWGMDELATIRNHHQQTSDMPILDDYKKLDKREQFRLDKQRWQLEQQHKAAIVRELEWLVAYRFPNVTLLH